MIWITWENQRRNVELSRSLGCQYFELNYDGRAWVYRYIMSSIRTFKHIRKVRPKIVFGQSPSLILAVLLLVLRRIFGFTLILDVHNAGMYPFEGKYSLLNNFAIKLQVLSDLILVTNKNLKSYVESHGGKAFVLPDRIPQIKSANQRRLPGKFNILFVCKFHKDEPFEEVFKSAALLPTDVYIHVTGNYKKLPSNSTENLPENLNLLGFVSEVNYVEMMCSVDAVLVLTTREDCLLCGAYEAVGAGKPAVLTDKKALKDYFPRGTVFVENDSVQIRNGINDLRKDLNFFKKDLLKGRADIEKKWDEKKIELIDLLKRF